MTTVASCLDTILAEERCKQRRLDYPHLSFNFQQRESLPCNVMKKIVLLLLLSSSLSQLQAQLRLPGLFDNHMVIQQNATVPIWGWAQPVQDVKINVSWDTLTVRTKSANTTFWKASIKTPPAGGPHSITIRAGNDVVTLTDVLSGEVWLCSGQSNMEWSMAAAGDGKTVMGQVNDPTIRLFQIPKSASTTRQVRGEGVWKICNAESVAGFSAVGYFFGKKLNTDLNVPIGIINASWGGTPAETWVARENIDDNESLKEAADKQIDDKPWCPSVPGVVFNSMINPLIPFRVAGVLWYQGESNTAAPYTYRELMNTLVMDWRKQFQYDFPFYYVQIAPYAGYGDIEKGALIREQEVKMLDIPGTGMVVIHDLVDNVNDIHPQFKKPVGERLANLALADTYKKSGVSYQSPLYAFMKIEKNRVRLSFNHAKDGLISKGGPPTEFTIAGDDHVFHPAIAKIDGSTIVVSSREVKRPVAVRFGWKNGSIPNLFGKNGLPVSSFRTDDWPIEVK